MKVKLLSCCSSLVCYVYIPSTDNDLGYSINHLESRLRVASNFCDSDRGVGENTHTRGRNSGETRRDARKFLAFPSLLGVFNYNINYRVRKVNELVLQQ